jgi:hypothetical protein
VISESKIRPTITEIGDFDAAGIEGGSAPGDFSAGWSLALLPAGGNIGGNKAAQSVSDHDPIRDHQLGFDRY